MDWFFSSGESYLSDIVNGILAVYLNIFNLTVYNLFSQQFIIDIVAAFRTLGWVLFSAGFIIAFLEYIIEANDGGGNWTNLVFNTAKGVVYSACFAGAPLELLIWTGTLTTNMASSMSGGIYQEMIGNDFVGNFTLIIQSEFNAVGSAPFWVVIISVILIIVFGFKIVLDNVSRAGSLLILIIIGTFHAFSIPRGYIDSAVGWCKQIIGLCFTHFMQNLLVITGFFIWTTGTNTVTYLCGLGTIFSATLVPKIAQQFSLDTSIKANWGQGVMVAGYTFQTATKLIGSGYSAVKTVGKDIATGISKFKNMGK